MRLEFIGRMWASRWTPMFLAVGMIGGFYGYRQIFLAHDGQDTFELHGDLLVHGNPLLREVALTFDDGPYGETTEQILDVLSKDEVPATFFVVGKHVDEHPDVVRRMMAMGNEVGNHSYTHPRLTDITIDQARKELSECEDAVYKATGEHMDLMRPPGMKYDDRLLRLAQDMGYTTVHWNAVAGDYLPTEPQMIVRRILWQVDNGCVILLHDSPDTVRALPELIRRLKVDGYRFVTVTQMLARLPRPVFVASNAGKVAPKPETLPIKETMRAPAIKRATPKKTGATSVQRPIVDDPVWDGHGS